MFSVPARLPNQKGLNLFPDTMRRPPIVRVKGFEDHPVEAGLIIQRFRGQIASFYNGCAQNYALSVVPINRKQVEDENIRMVYTNISGVEYIDVTVYPASTIDETLKSFIEFDVIVGALLSFGNSYLNLDYRSCTLPGGSTDSNHKFYEPHEFPWSVSSTITTDPFGLALILFPNPTIFVSQAQLLPWKVEEPNAYYAPAGYLYPQNAGSDWISSFEEEIPLSANNLGPYSIRGNYTRLVPLNGIDTCLTDATNNFSVFQSANLPATVTVNDIICPKVNQSAQWQLPVFGSWGETYIRATYRGRMFMLPEERARVLGAKLTLFR